MTVDLPLCDMKKCRYNFDCNCRNKVEYERCNYQIQKEKFEKLKKFKEYFDDLYGQGYEIANWHMNGDLEPFDNFYESALDYSE